MRKVIGVLWLLGICCLAYYTVSKELDTFALIQEGKTVPGLIIDTWTDIEGDDETNVLIYIQGVTYKYRVPDGREFTKDAEISEKLRKKIANERVWPYPIEVEYLPAKPTVSSIKGEGLGIVGWAFGELGILLLLLVLLSVPGIFLIRRKGRETSKNNK